MKRVYTLLLVVVLIFGLTACSKNLVKGSAHREEPAGSIRTIYTP